MQIRIKNIILLCIGISALSSCQKADENNPVQVDVYIAGYGFGTDAQELIPIARYWKNGLPVDLTDGSEVAMANSIFVSKTMFMQQDIRHMEIALMLFTGRMVYLLTCHVT